MFFSNPCL